MKFVFFSVSENGENGFGDEGADGAMWAMSPPQNFWARTAPASTARTVCEVILSIPALIQIIRLCIDLSDTLPACGFFRPVCAWRSTCRRR